MPFVKTAALLVTGLALAGCDGALNGGYPTTSQESYSAPGYYGAPPSPASEYYAAPVYPGPGYYQQPVYVVPNEPGWRPGREGWHDHDRYDRDRYEHEGYGRGGPAYGNDGRQPRQDFRQAPQMATQPRMPPGPPIAAPPSVPRPQADQNKRLMDQLGFRPSH